MRRRRAREAERAGRRFEHETSAVEEPPLWPPGSTPLTYQEKVEPRTFRLKLSNVLLYLGLGSVGPVVGGVLLLAGGGMQSVSSSPFGDVFATGGAIGGVGLLLLVLSIGALCHGLSLLLIRPHVTVSAEGVEYRHSWGRPEKLLWREVVGVYDTDIRLTLERHGKPMVIPADFEDYRELVALVDRLSGQP